MTTRHAQPPKPPRRPWFKDEKILRGHITMRFSVRVILLVVLLTIGLLLVAALFVVNEVDKVNKLAHDNLTNQTTGHVQRLADEAAAEAREDEKVAQLACSIVSLVPPGVNAGIDQLRVRYDCTPGATATPTAPGQPSSVPTARPTGTPTSTSQSPQSQGHSPLAPATAMPTRTTAGPTPAPTTGPLVGTLCSIGRILHLCSSP